MNNKIIPDLRTYEDYVDLGKVNTKRYLMISELIDNSISSFDEYYGEGNWGKKLEITIEIDNLNSETSLFNNIEYFEGSKITIEDNAFGIKSEKLSDALRLNKKNNSNSSKMNVHGRGLKQSAFYFGLGVEVISKHVDSDETFSIENRPIKFGIDKDVKYRVLKSEKDIDSGTIIIIEDLRKTHRFTESRLNEVFDALSYRYSKLISSEKMSIKFKYRINNEEEWKKYEISNAPDDVARIKEDFDYTLSNRNEIAKIANKIVKELIANSNEKRNIYKYPKLAMATADKLSKLIKTKNLKDKFLWEEDIKINDEESVKAKFWLISRKSNNKEESSEILKRGYSIKRGIRINEGDRSILHPPIIPNEVSTYLDPLPTSNRSGAVDNRFAGEVNIDSISAQTTTDKSTFEFKSQEDKEAFDDQISVIFDVFEQFVLQGRSSNKYSAAAKFTKEDQNKLETTITSKFKDVVKEISFDNDERNSITSKIIFERKEFALRISINEKPTPLELVSVKIDWDNSEVEATWFTNHNLWKNINESRNFNIEALVPIFLLLVLQEMQFEKKIGAIKNFTQKQKDDIRPSKNLNEMSKGIK